MKLNKKIVGIILAVLCIVAVYVIPGPEGLSLNGWHAVGGLFAIVIIWVTDAFPRYVAALLAILVFAWMGIFTSWNVAYQNFFTQTSIVVLGCFFITAMMNTTDIPLRLMGFFLKITKKSGKAFLAVILGVTAVFSGVMSDMAAASIMYAFTISLFNVQPNVTPEKTPRLIKAILVGIPLSALAGGMFTPVGAATNVMTVTMLEQATGITMTFLQWVTAFVPTVIVIMVIVWGVLVVIIRPEDLDDEIVNMMTTRIADLGKLRPQEVKSIVVLLGMIVLWVAGSWITPLNTAAVIVIGAAVMMFPGIDIITPADFQKSASWDLFFQMGGIMILGAGITQTDLLDWIVANTLGGVFGFPTYLIFVAVGVIIVLMRTLIPAGPPIMLLTIPAMIALASAAGINPVIMLMVGNIWGQLAFFLPVDVMYALTYESGQYSIKDMFKVHLPMVIILILVMSALAPIFAGFAS